MSGFSRLARSRWSRAAAVAGVLLALALAVPFLVPLSAYIPDVTRAAEQRLGQPVTLQNIRLHLLPTPRIALYSIKVGRGAPLAIDELRVVPALTSLFGERIVIRLVRADGVRVRQAALAMLERMPKSTPGGTQVRIERIDLRHVSFDYRILKVPPFDLNVDLGPDYAPRSAELRTVDDALEARLEPQGDDVARVTLQGRGWRLPLRVAPLAFASLEASGTLRAGRLELPTVAGRLYGGTLAGSFYMSWSRGWQLGGKADIAGVALVPLFKDLGKPARLSGKLNTQVVFSARAKAAAQLGDALVLDAPAAVQGGAWHGIDLARAAEMPLGNLSGGGETPFETLRAIVALRGKTVRLDDICARSPDLVAGGHVEVAPDDALSGLLDVSVAKTAGIVGVPLALDGTLSEPSVGLTRAAKIGAVLGTLVLPGVGTTVGATAGAKLDSFSACK
jgi:hypothetical protein